MAQSGQQASENDKAQKPAPAPQPEAAPPERLEFSDNVVHDVLETLQSGIQSHSLTKVLSVFDPEAMPDYPTVRDQFRAFFVQYNVLQFRYKLLQATADKSGGSATAEIDIDATPEDENLMPLRRSTQMRFQLKQTAKGWKVIGFTPADFFAQ